ncbi:hypothetical protein E2493_15150 [Sphingomonas parva]|uniref:Uncharacterized protein n=1 Tax=Sphingomonas parva TaxID=2555898 RepID=A0A4Y8ZN82_9SPHN|nr:hypothetical protein [Sphingomonas parva]TFI57414.1 hypothetical protein E2493_15150 [Sphingomonas parva]
MVYWLSNVVGAILGALIFGTLISTAIDRAILRRVIDDPVVAIAVSSALAFVVIVTIAAFGMADGRPVSIANVPLIGYAVGMAISAALRLKLHSRKLQRAETLNGVEETFR